MISETQFFECIQCGDCCKGYGGTYLTEMDMAAIAAHLEISTATFKENYCTRSGNRYVLAQREDGFCIFFNRNCTIHAIKPAMCRKWPFIDSLMIDIGNWKAMSSVCPGMRTEVNEEHLREFVCESLNATCGLKV